MKTNRNKQRIAKGRRRYGSKFANPAIVLPPYAPHPRPYGWAWPVENIGNRNKLLKYFPPFLKKRADALISVPRNFSQVADKLLGEKQLKQNNAELYKKLDDFQARNNVPGRRHPCWNFPEVPSELLCETLANSAAWAVQQYEIIQRALARLYAVAWFGHGFESIEAKSQLEKLIPAGKTHPFTKYVPEIAERFGEMWGWIRESNQLMKQDFPREIGRVKELAELYAETSSVISAALRSSKRPFVTERLAEVLCIPKETARKHLPPP